MQVNTEGTCVAIDLHFLAFAGLSVDTPEQGRFASCSLGEPLERVARQLVPFAWENAGGDGWLAILSYFDWLAGYIGWLTGWSHDTSRLEGFRCSQQLQVGAHPGLAGQLREFCAVRPLLPRAQF